MSSNGIRPRKVMGTPSVASSLFKPVLSKAPVPMVAFTPVVDDPMESDAVQDEPAVQGNEEEEGKEEFASHSPIQNEMEEDNGGEPEGTPEESTGPETEEEKHRDQDMLQENVDEQDQSVAEAGDEQPMEEDMAESEMEMEPEVQPEPEPVKPIIMTPSKPIKVQQVPNAPVKVTSTKPSFVLKPATIPMSVHLDAVATKRVEEKKAAVPEQKTPLKTIVAKPNPAFATSKSPANAAPAGPRVNGVTFKEGVVSSLLPPGTTLHLEMDKAVKEQMEEKATKPVVAAKKPEDTIELDLSNDIHCEALVRTLQRLWEGNSENFTFPERGMMFLEYLFGLRDSSEGDPIGLNVSSRTASAAEVMPSKRRSECMTKPLETTVGQPYYHGDVKECREEFAEDGVGYSTISKGCPYLLRPFGAPPGKLKPCFDVVECKIHYKGDASTGQSVEPFSFPTREEMGGKSVDRQAYLAKYENMSKATWSQMVYLRALKKYTEDESNGDMFEYIRTPSTGTSQAKTQATKFYNIHGPPFATNMIHPIEKGETPFLFGALSYVSSAEPFPTCLVALGPDASEVIHQNTIYEWKVRPESSNPSDEAALQSDVPTELLKTTFVYACLWTFLGNRFVTKTSSVRSGHTLTSVVLNPYVPDFLGGATDMYVENIFKNEAIQRKRSDAMKYIMRQILVVRNHVMNKVPFLKWLEHVMLNFFGSKSYFSTLRSQLKEFKGPTTMMESVKKLHQSVPIVEVKKVVPLSILPVSKTEAKAAPVVAKPKPVPIEQTKSKDEKKKSKGAERKKKDDGNESDVYDSDDADKDRSILSDDDSASESSDSSSSDSSSSDSESSSTSDSSDEEDKNKRKNNKSKKAEEGKKKRVSRCKKDTKRTKVDAKPEKEEVSDLGLMSFPLTTLNPTKTAATKPVVVPQRTTSPPKTKSGKEEEREKLLKKQENVLREVELKHQQKKGEESKKRKTVTESPPTDGDIVMQTDDKAVPEEDPSVPIKKQKKPEVEGKEENASSEHALPLQPFMQSMFNYVTSVFQGKTLFNMYGKKFNPNQFSIEDTADLMVECLKDDPASPYNDITTYVKSVAAPNVWTLFKKSNMKPSDVIPFICFLMIERVFQRESRSYGKLPPRKRTTEGGEGQTDNE